MATQNGTPMPVPGTEPAPEIITEYAPGYYKNRPVIVAPATPVPPLYYTQVMTPPQQTLQITPMQLVIGALLLYLLLRG